MRQCTDYQKFESDRLLNELLQESDTLNLMRFIILGMSEKQFAYLVRDASTSSNLFSPN